FFSSSSLGGGAPAETEPPLAMAHAASPNFSGVTVPEDRPTTSQAPSASSSSTTTSPARERRGREVAVGLMRAEGYGRPPGPESTRPGSEPPGPSSRADLRRGRRRARHRPVLADD